MFPIQPPNPVSEPVVKSDNKIMNKYKNFIAAAAATGDSALVDESNAIGNRIDKLLEIEKQNLSTEPWNKLDKRLKIQKLHAFAEKYGKENALPQKDIKSLKTFFSECLTKDKLAKVKEVDYNKTTGIIQAIPGLCLNATTRAFTLRNLEKKVSTLKSLTPKKNAESVSVVKSDEYA